MGLDDGFQATDKGVKRFASIITAYFCFIFIKVYYSGCKDNYFRAVKQDFYIIWQKNPEGKPSGRCVIINNDALQHVINCYD